MFLVRETPRRLGARSTRLLVAAATLLPAAWLFCVVVQSVVVTMVFDGDKFDADQALTRLFASSK